MNIDAVSIIEIWKIECVSSCLSFPLALIFSSWYFYDIFQSLKIIIIIFFSLNYA